MGSCVSAKMVFVTQRNEGGEGSRLKFMRREFSRQKQRVKFQET